MIRSDRAPELAEDDAWDDMPPLEDCEDLRSKDELDRARRDVREYGFPVFDVREYGFPVFDEADVFTPAELRLGPIATTRSPVVIMATTPGHPRSLFVGSRGREDAFVREH